MNKRNAKIGIGIVILLVISFFWGEFSPLSNNGLPEVDENIVIQKSEDKSSAGLEEYSSGKKIERDESENISDDGEEVEEDILDEKAEAEVASKEDSKVDSKAENKEVKDNSNIESKENESDSKQQVAKDSRVGAATMAMNPDTVSLKVSVKTLVKNKDKLDKNKADLVPKNGVIYNNSNVSILEGDTVFDVLLREMIDSNIHLESSMTPMYKTNYVEGINNIYEFDAGELSGWMYKVNGEFPSYGASEVEVKPGDVIEWLYTCDLGKDIGGKNSTGGRR